MEFVAKIFGQKLSNGISVKVFAPKVDDFNRNFITSANIYLAFDYAWFSRFKL